MMISISYKDPPFERATLTPICGEPTFETLHKLRNEIKANTKFLYSDIGGGAHGHLGLVLTNFQSALISPTPFAYPTHLGMLIILGGTTAHENSNMRIAHTKKVCLYNKLPFNKSLKRSRKRTLLISATGQQTQSMTPWRM